MISKEQRKLIKAMRSVEGRMLFISFLFGIAIGGFIRLLMSGFINN